MAIETVKVTIPADPEDPVKIQVEGVKGTRCLDVTQGVEAAFGGIQGDDRVFTDEHKQREVSVTSPQQQHEGN
jgi:hypothetical protein